MRFSEETLHRLMATYSTPLLVEFEEDLSRMATIVRLLRKFKTVGDVNIKLVINYMVISYNVFGYQFTDILRQHIEDETLPYFNALMVYMGRSDDEPIDLEFLEYIKRHAGD